MGGFMIRTPAEWETQKALWLSWPHHEENWGYCLDKIEDFYQGLITTVLDFQDVNLLCASEKIKSKVERLKLAEHSRNSINLYHIPNDDIWIRDYGPIYVEENRQQKLLNFKFNSWGRKFPPWDLDDNAANRIAEIGDQSVSQEYIVLEGGAMEFNGLDLAMTTDQCLLNPNRNPSFNKDQLTTLIKEKFGVKDVLWLKYGIEGDHTDGHIDDVARFVGPDRVALCMPDKRDKINYENMRTNLERIHNFNYKLRVVTLPMPEEKWVFGERLASSYANFIILNGAVLVPQFDDVQDEVALNVLSEIFPKHKVIPVDCNLVIREGGSLHCLSKNEFLI